MSIFNMRYPNSFFQVMLKSSVTMLVFRAAVAAVMVIVILVVQV